MKKKMTRQEQWQKKRIEEGKCRQCGEAADGKARCPTCLKKDSTAHKNHDPADGDGRNCDEYGCEEGK